MPLSAVDADGSVLVPAQGAWIPAAAVKVAAELHRYDPDLTLCPRVDGKTGVLVRYEVWAKDRTGGSYLVGWWMPGEVNQIVQHVRVQDRNAHDHTPVQARIEKTNSRMRRDARSRLVDAVGEAYEHIDAVKRRLEEGRTFFGMRGRIT